MYFGAVADIYITKMQIAILIACNRNLYNSTAYYLQKLHIHISCQSLYIS